MKLPSINVTATIKGQQEKLKYLGGMHEGQGGISEYLRDNDLKKSFDENNTAVVLAIIWNICQDCCHSDKSCCDYGSSEENKKLQDHSEKLKCFMEKWFRHDLGNELDNTKFFDFHYLNWANESEDEMEYSCVEEDIRLKFAEPDYYMYDSTVFIKERYYDELVNDLTVLYNILFSSKEEL